MLNNRNKQKFSQHYFDIKDNAGFSLVELIAAMAVFTIGIMGTLSLASSNFNRSNDNLDKIIAANLAREGVELIRNLRDTNWLKEENNIICGGDICPWDFDLRGEEYVFIAYNDTVPTGCLAYDCAGSEIMKNVNNYDHAGTEATKYSRVMKLEKICLDDTNLTSNPQAAESITDGSQPCVSSEYIGLQVTAHVEWEDNGTRSIEIVDKIYDWKR